MGKNVFRMTPVRDVLEARAVDCLATLRTRDSIEFELAYLLAVGCPAPKGKDSSTLVPPEMEALLDLGMVMGNWRSTHDVRPPENHLEVLSSLRRIGGRAHFIGGVLTQEGRDVVERYDAERDGTTIPSK